MSKFTVEDYEDCIIKIKEDVSSRNALILLLEEKLKEMRVAKKNTIYWNNVENPISSGRWRDERERFTWSISDMKLSIRNAKYEINQLEKDINSMEGKMEIEKIKMGLQEKSLELTKDTMICQFCGNITKKARFCVSCGAKL